MTDHLTKHRAAMAQMATEMERAIGHRNTIELYNSVHSVHSAQ